MKYLFFFLLKRYSRTETQRLEILKHLDKQIYYTYNEQTTFGNVYNYFIEFIISNKFIRSRVKEDDTQSLEILKRGISKSFDESVQFIKNEK